MSNNNFLNFIIIGTQKAGTTWLSRRLNEHPEIFLPPNELHYFDLDQNYKKGLDWYRKQFNDKPKDAKSVGEKTPDYLWTNRPHQNKINIAERIHQLDPDLKLIIILRNPVKRAISAYNHFLRNGWINFKENPDNYFLDPAPELSVKSGLIEQGYYLKNIKIYLNLFPKENLKILIYEEDLFDPDLPTFKDLFDHLNVDASFKPDGFQRTENRQMNTKVGLQLYNLSKIHFKPIAPLISAFDRLLPNKSSTVKPSDEVIKKLYKLYEPHNHALFEFLGHEIKSWSQNT